MLIKTILPPKKGEPPIEIRIGDDITIQLRRRKDGASSLQLAVDAPRGLGITVSQQGPQPTIES